DHPLCLHRAYHAAAERGQPALLAPLHRAGERTADKMGTPRHPKTRSLQIVQLGDAPSKTLQPFDTEQRADRGGLSPSASSEQRVQIDGICDDTELAA